jgi:SAM-dependent methyltransferase
MKASEYPRFFELETTHWWFRGLHSVLIKTLGDLGLGDESLVLDAGCGTGGLMALLSDNTDATVIGFDIAAEASQFWTARGLATTFRGSVNAIPLQTDSLDAVFCINVFECDEVEPATAYEELWRVAKPGGYLILSMPAHHWLGDKTHDAAVNGSRRFVRKELAAIVNSRPAEIKLMTHLFPFFLPVITAWRFINGIRPRAPEAEAHTDLSRLPNWINTSLFLLTQVERMLLKFMGFPFGSSLLCVARKPLPDREAPQT